MSQTPWGAPPPPQQQWPPRGQRPPQQWPAQQWPAQPGWGEQRPPSPWQRPPQQPWPQQAWQRPPQQSWPAPPPRRRRSGLGNAVRVVISVVAIIMFASFVRGLLDQVSSIDLPTQPGPTRPDAPVPAPQVPGDPTSPYQNEGYAPPPPTRNPPAVPGPRNMDAAGRLVQANPLYDQAIPTPTNCQMVDIDINRASPSEKERHFNELMGCLMTVFAGPVEGSGFEMPRPPVVVYSRPIKTACGDFSEVNAAYCTGDQRVYYANSLLRAFPPDVANADHAAEMVLAHEFGHAVQARTAILISEKYLEQDARSERAALELSRRTEVQADCLSGQYIRSVAQSQSLGPAELEGLSALAWNLGDDVLSGQPGYSGGHGSGNARRDWFNRGLSSDSIAVCNSFVAASDAVR